MAEKEHVVRLEVSLDLEGFFTDSFCGYIEREQLLPFFDSGMIGYGLQGTIEAVVQKTWEMVDAKALDVGEPGQEEASLKTEHLSGGGGAKKDFEVGEKYRNHIFLLVFQIIHNQYPPL